MYLIFVCRTLYVSFTLSSLRYVSFDQYNSEEAKEQVPKNTDPFEVGTNAFLLQLRERNRQSYRRCGRCAVSHEFIMIPHACSIEGPTDKTAHFQRGESRDTCAATLSLAEMLYKTARLRRGKVETRAQPPSHWHKCFITLNPCFSTKSQTDHAVPETPQSRKQI